MKCNVCGLHIVKIESTLPGWLDAPCHKGYRPARLITKFEGDNE